MLIHILVLLCINTMLYLINLFNENLINLIVLELYILLVPSLSHLVTGVYLDRSLQEKQREPRVVKLGLFFSGSYQPEETHFGLCLSYALENVIHLR